MEKILIILLSLINIKFMNASHFRGGLLYWNAVFSNSSMVIVDATIKLAWDRSSCNCDQNDVINQNKTLCYTGPLDTTGTQLAPFKGVYCTDFSVTEQWAYGEVTIPIIFNNNQSVVHSIAYSGGYWITLLNGGMSWNLSTIVDLKIRNDTKRINQSPISSMSPVIRVKAGCYQQVSIPSQDPDGDFIRCRWANGTECGDSCLLPDYVELDEETCLLKFNLTNLNGMYALKIQLEDFESKTSKKPLSSIPLQFLVDAYTPFGVGGGNCIAAKPVFVDPTKQDQACVNIPSNTTYKDIILVNSNKTNVKVIEIQTISPPGMVKSNLYLFNDTFGYVDLTWSPRSVGVSLLCFIGVDSSGESSAQRCIKLAVGYDLPKPIQISPLKNVTSDQQEWTLIADKILTRPSFSSFIKFFDNETGSVVYKIDAMNSSDVEINQYSLIFRTGNFLIEKKFYYITFDGGVLTGAEGCNLNGEKIDSKDFWLFYVQETQIINQISPIFTFSALPAIIILALIIATACCLSMILACCLSGFIIVLCKRKKGKVHNGKLTKHAW
jgi:hypothetical protein